MFPRHQLAAISHQAHNRRTSMQGTSAPNAQLACIDHPSRVSISISNRASATNVTADEVGEVRVEPGGDLVLAALDHRVHHVDRLARERNRATHHRISATSTHVMYSTLYSTVQ